MATQRKQTVQEAAEEGFNKSLGIQKIAPGAIELPDFITAGDNRGTEHIEKDDIELPRLLIAQGLSPQIIPGDPSYLPGLIMGHMFNSMTKQNYANGPLEFTVIRADVPRWVEFIPREQGGGVLDPNVPADDPRTQFRVVDGKSVPPAATKFYDFVIMFLPSRELVALSFKSTGLRVAKHLNSLLKYRKAPCFAGKYTMTSNVAKNAKGSFGMFRVQNSAVEDDCTSKPGFVSLDVYKFAEEVYQGLKGKELKIDREPGEDDEVTGAEEEM